MAKVQITIRNENGKRELHESVEITTQKYRDYLLMNQSLNDEKLSEVEKLDKQLEFIASLFSDVTLEMLLEYTDMGEVYQIFADLYLALVGDTDPKEKA